MIFPILSGFQSFFRAPVTWCIFFLNFAVFILTFRPAQQSQIALENYLRGSAFTETQGLVFAKYVQAHKSRYIASVVRLADHSVQPSELDRRDILGGIALRDNEFINHSDNLSDNIGDPVAFEWWRNQLSKFKTVRDLDPTYQLGVTSQNCDFFHWITYQFAHSGIAHFVGNMLFFLIFATSLESVIGGLGVLVIYLLSGIAAALFFTSVSDASAIPLIGASGAISGLVAFFCVLFWRRGVRYVYFLFIPKRGYTGLVYLPTWITLVLWMLSDFAGLWSTPPELGGIAYAAHLGGELCGILAALIFIGLRKWRGIEVLPKRYLFEADAATVVRS